MRIAISLFLLPCLLYCAPPTEAGVASVFAQLTADGYSTDLDYTTGDDLLPHLHRMDTLALAQAQQSGPIVYATADKREWVTDSIFTLSVDHGPRPAGERTVTKRYPLP